ncbi:terpene cyclase/mutase family protein [Streptomyces sp. TG1A-8]|uniref:prenyltransferase/squalene oxidase repeat-containing protein n=1 Tax=Streptomyces sp. TG1A-8 TaxID=3051385 RepID=UPI00265BC5A6|nr:prenyltransferase/squalene oxidase repeat-containing protein [Streptomyces sp. TG1A-8]MDO0929010.1 terpene cyclase/mutase family protein [Streptomyces sp. TG1A-8]
MGTVFSSAQTPISTKLTDAAAGALDRAVAYAIGEAKDGSCWVQPSEPRILETAVVASAVARDLGPCRPVERARRWIADADPQDHDPLVHAADLWLRDAALNTAAPDATELIGRGGSGVHGRRALYLQAVATAVGAAGSEPANLLAKARAGLGSDDGQSLKPWQRTVLHAAVLIASRALGDAPLPSDLSALHRAQLPDGSFHHMPMITGLAYHALISAAPYGTATARCRDRVLADQHPDGTWRFLTSDIWDTALMVRCLRGHKAFDTTVLAGALGHLERSQNRDGGWGCAQGFASDNDSVGSTLLALAETGHGLRTWPGAARYARQQQTPEGWWTTWLSSDDMPAQDVAAHMICGILAHRRTPAEVMTDAAQRWLRAEYKSHGGWRADWYIPEAYAVAEIGPAVGWDTAESRGALRALLRAQHADGGWPGLPGAVDSSPAATGLAVTALMAGDVPAESALERATRFLIDTQDYAGTWVDAPIMFGPRPFLTPTGVQVHALAARGLRDLLGRTRRFRTGTQ